MSRENSFYLFARPSFVEGISRVLDLGNTLQIYNEHEAEREADFAAIKRDWKAVGKDIKDGIERYEQQK